MDEDIQQDALAALLGSRVATHGNGGYALRGIRPTSPATRFERSDSAYRAAMSQSYRDWEPIEAEFTLGPWAPGV